MKTSPFKEDFNILKTDGQSSNHVTNFIFLSICWHLTRRRFTENQLQVLVIKTHTHVKIGQKIDPKDLKSFF